VSGRSGDFSVEEKAARRQILEQSFSGQLEACARAFHRLAYLERSDASVLAITRCLREVLVHFPIYRTYGPCEDRAHDAPFLIEAFSAATSTVLSSDRVVLDRLQSWLSEPITGESADLQRRAVTRFQQLSAPLAAKAVEDTAAYRYGRLLSRNDVGFDLKRLGATVDEFHARAMLRRREYPHALLATATHDHKRGEDVRARLAAISEVPELWGRLLADWIDRSAAFCQTLAGKLSPTPGDIAMLFQTIVGSWPLKLAAHDNARFEYADRVARWQQKALREAKLETDWIAPDSDYEAASRSFLMRLVADRVAPALLDDMVSFTRTIAPAGAVNGLTQALLKLTAPGVPDFYQGTEYWDLSLVDPDNRRPVDFDQRIATLENIDVDDLVANWRDGGIKQHIIARVLALRRKSPEIFSEGSYQPIAFSGTHADHVFGFIRRHGDEAAVVIVPRLVHQLLGEGAIIFQAESWGNTAALVDVASDVRFVNLFTGDSVDLKQAVSIQSLLGRVPVALLIRQGLT
jgi:malto-oligosyltrehalose synthase